jgi:hypothetical protein
LEADRQQAAAFFVVRSKTSDKWRRIESRLVLIAILKKRLKLDASLSQSCERSA